MFESATLVILMLAALACFFLSGFVSPRRQTQDEAAHFRSVVRFKFGTLSLGLAIGLVYLACRIWSATLAITKSLN